jgi:hypothetical protein
MKTTTSGTIVGLCLGLALGFATPAANAQMAEVKEKPRMYTYQASWEIPRARWAEYAKGNPTSDKILDKALSSGSLVGYGGDENLIHQPDGMTHDGWWSAMSMAGVLNILDEMYKSGSAASPVFESATKHSDGIYVSRYYNWRPGTYKGAYTHTAVYKLKADAPNDAVTMLSKTFIVPLMEKLLADGSIVEYEIDEESIHTQSPDYFFLDYITATAEGQDKVSAALTEALKDSPLAGPAFGSMVDFSGHRDFLSRTNAVYK